MKFVVNGVEYTDYEEAKKAEIEVQNEEAKKAAAALTKKEKAEAIKEAFTNLRTVENTATKEYDKAVSAAQEELKKAKEAYVAACNEAAKIYREQVSGAEQEYLKLKNEFINEYGSYHMSYYNNGTNEELTISDTIANIVNSAFKCLF